MQHLCVRRDLFIFYIIFQEVLEKSEEYLKLHPELTKALTTLFEHLIQVKRLRYDNKLDQKRNFIRIL